MVVIFTLLYLLTAANAAEIDPSFPSYPNQFIVKTTEFSSIGEQILNQTLDWDTTQRRTHMKAEGIMLAGGVLEQVTRCDVGWETGWFAQADTSDPMNVRATSDIISLELERPPSRYNFMRYSCAQDPSTWECTNTTRNPDQDSCQMGDFWEAPPLYQFKGNETINGVWTCSFLLMLDLPKLSPFHQSVRFRAPQPATGR